MNMKQRFSKLFAEAFLLLLLLTGCSKDEESGVSTVTDADGATVEEIISI